MVPVVGPRRSRDSGLLLAAKLRAAPSVRAFTARVFNCEAELMADLGVAFQLLMSESVRSAMIASCRNADLWPPPQTASTPQRRNVDKEPRDPTDSCSCSDGEDDAVEPDVYLPGSPWEGHEPLPVTAQRLFEEEAARAAGDAASPDDAGAAAARAARTAAFLADFAHQSGAPTPPPCEEMQWRIGDFVAHVAEWQRQRDEEPEPESWLAQLRVAAPAAVADLRASATMPLLALGAAAVALGRPTKDAVGGMAATLGGLSPTFGFPGQAAADEGAAPRKRNPRAAHRFRMKTV